MGINLSKIIQNTDVSGIKKAVKSANVPAKFNTGILDKDTVTFSTSALKKLKTPIVSELTQIPDHHDINGLNMDIRSVVKKLQNGGELKRFESRMLGIIEDIDNDFKKLPPLEDDFVFYRGRGKHPCFPRFNEDFDIIEKAKIGENIVPDGAYSYGAFKKEVAENWAKDMLCEIRVPKGARLSRNNEHGGEVLFPRGAKYRLISKEKDDRGVLNVVLEYLLPKE